MRTQNKIRRKSIAVFAMLLCLFVGIDANSQETKRILFLGNSYTHTNDLPSMISNLAESQGKSIYHESKTPGGTWFSGHFNDESTRNKIAQGNWDIIVLQGQSQEVAFPDGQFDFQVYPYAKALDSLSKAHNPQVRVVFYMTWGYRYGDPMNCPYFEPFCTFEGMGNRLKDNYLKMARDFSSEVSPVGAAWMESIATDSTIVLHSSDNSHPNVNGTYLAACCFYETIFKERIEEAWKPNNVSQEIAQYLQGIANRVVFERLQEWDFTQNNSSLEPEKGSTIEDFDAFVQNNEIIINTRNISGQTSVELIASDGRTLSKQTYSLSKDEQIKLRLAESISGVCIVRLCHNSDCIGKKIIVIR